MHLLLLRFDVLLQSQIFNRPFGELRLALLHDAELLFFAGCCRQACLVLSIVDRLLLALLLLALGFGFFGSFVLGSCGLVLLLGHLLHQLDLLLDQIVVFLLLGNQLLLEIERLLRLVEFFLRGVQLGLCGVNRRFLLALQTVDLVLGFQLGNPVAHGVRIDIPHVVRQDVLEPVNLLLTILRGIGLLRFVQLGLECGNLLVVLRRDGVQVVLRLLHRVGRRLDTQH